MKIGVDMDSVIADLIPPMVAFHNERYHTDLTVSSHSNYNLSVVWKCDPTDVLFRIFEYYESPHFDRVMPIKGAVEGINRLSEKHELILITARPHRIEHKTHAWLQKHFHGKFNKILHTNLVSSKNETRKKKSQVCKEEGISAMIDDAPDYAIDCASEGIQVYLFPALWNKTIQPHKLIRPVSGWDEIVTLL